MNVEGFWELKLEGYWDNLLNDPKRTQVLVIMLALRPVHFQVLN